VKTRFWSFVGKDYVGKLCKELRGVDHMYIVLTNAFDNDTYRKIGRAARKVEGALIYSR